MPGWGTSGALLLCMVAASVAMAPLAGSRSVMAGEEKNTAREAATGAGRVFRDCSDCPEMVEIAAGAFVMGSPPDEPPVKLLDQMSIESPQHKVTIAKPFAAGRFEVTFAEWDACVADQGCAHVPDDNGGGRGRRPVVNVSWNDITREYLPWLARKTGKPYRLLTEAEWNTQREPARQRPTPPAGLSRGRRQTPIPIRLTSARTPVANTRPTSARSLRMHSGCMTCMGM
jgi:formylglycine-generating enzyme required for sulfatase activity